MDAQNLGLLPEFEVSAAPPPERVTVTLEMDADLLAWLKREPLGLQAEINNAVRFIMDMSNTPAPPPLDDAWEPDFDLSPEALAQGEETAGPDPARNADKIAHDFVP
jgi:hypothetical protein